MSSYTAAADFVRRVRAFAQATPDWAECVIYDTLPDEAFDLTLASRRVYGTPDEFLAIMAAAGLDSVEQELTARRLVLPTARQLAALKVQAGLNTDRFARTPEQAARPLTER